MDISQTKNGDILVIKLVGRLDASWSGAVQKEFDATVRKGEHRIHLDMEKVDYISSAGLGVLLTLYKELHAIKGQFGICGASPFVASALKLAGLSSLITKSGPAATPKAAEGRKEKSARASYEIFSGQGSGVTLSVTGHPDALQKGGCDSEKLTFDAKSFALGIGALGADTDGCDSRFGEFLAVSGAAVFQPVDGANRPDFQVTKGELLPEGRLMLGLHGKGEFPILARFEAAPEFRTVGLAELAAAALDFSGANVVVVAAITETAGLVGTALRQSPARPSTGSRFEFPEIRNWLAFSNERVFRDSTSLVVGVAARPGSPYDALLRPLGSNILGHFHAAAFPYRPLQKGFIELSPTVSSLFDGNTINAVLHLLADTREFSGAGESEFLRGALWISPVQPSSSAKP